MRKKDKDKTEAEEIVENIEETEVTEEALSPEAVLGAKNAELLDKLQRSLAEFDNFRKRTVKEKSEMFDIGAISVVEKILPVADNFERALSSASDKEDSMYKGILMIYKQLEETLKSVGVEPIDCIGQKFDPKLHNAVAHENIEGEQESVITEELLRGYKYKDKVIRPSMVKVAN